MVLRRVSVVAVFVCLLVVTSRGQSSQSGRPWPPGVQTVSEESPVLTPDEALKTFHLAPGYHIELVAAEPLVHDPTVIEWDADGRLWVVEMTGFVRDLDAPEPNLAPIGNVVVLEDTNGDGRMDKRTVFADGLAIPRAVKVLKDGVLVAEPGRLYWMKDTNGDLKADSRELVTSEYGRRDGSVEGNANGLYWGLDNWMQTSGADIYLRRGKDGTFQVKHTLLRGEWGVTEDDAGRVYRNTNENALHVDLVPTPYFARNPTLLRTRGSYESLSVNNDDLNTVWPVRPNPGTNRAYQVGIDRADGTLAKFTAVCAPVVFRGDRLPAELYGNVFVAEPAGNLVSRLVLTDTNGVVSARKAYPDAEFLASTDERFRPVYISSAPDGTLYVADLYRGIIQDRASTTTYLRDYIQKKKLDAPTGLGRIYRVVHDTTRRGPVPHLSTATPAQLVAALSHPNGWWRDTAQRLLVERNATAVQPALVALATNGATPQARLRALWTLDGLDLSDPQLVTKALADPAPEVRASAIRLSERWLGDASNPIQQAVLARLDDSNVMVRQQLAASLGELAPASREAALITVIERLGDDPIAMDAALSGLRGSELAVLTKMLAPGGAESPQRSAAITMLTAMLVRGNQDATIQQLLADVANAQMPSWQRSAVLRGAEVALIGTAMPGTPARRGGPPPVTPQPCAGCPGSRSGPGGSYAFPGVLESQAAPSAGRGGPVLRLSREPATFTAIATGTDELPPRVTSLLARIEWPGKPGARAPLAPLTAEEQSRFDAGRDVYRNLCQNCHQPDGRGQERIAASLVGSVLALAPADITTRILISGKEGPIGLMPPLGAGMSDADIASVLTYIRREWGQPGTPVAPDAVATTRTATVDRTKPWTNDELMQLVNASNANRSN